MVSAKITDRLFIGVELSLNWAEIWVSENSEVSEVVSMSEHIVSDSDPEIVEIEFTELFRGVAFWAEFWAAFRAGFLSCIFESESEIFSTSEDKIFSGIEVDSKLSEIELSELKFELSESVMKSSVDFVRLYLLLDFFKMGFSGFLLERNVEIGG